MMRRYGRSIGYVLLLTVALALFGTNPVSGQPFAAQIQALLRRSNSWLGTQTFTNVTVTGTCTGCGGVTYPLLAPNGSAAAPSYAFTSVPGTGFYTFDGSDIRTGISGTLRWIFGGSILTNSIDGAGLTLGSTGPVTILHDSAAGIGAIKNGANPTTWRVYGTTTGPKYIALSHDGTNGVLDTAASAGLISIAPTNATSITFGKKISSYNGITTAGQGIPIIVAQARTVAATNTGTASVATFTVGAADGTFEVGCNVLITTSTTHSFSCDTTYTDESNVARTMVMPVEQLAGTFATSGLMTNATGAGPYESAVMTIRAKAATAITIRTSAGGTFTAVVYNIDGTIKQVG